MCSESPRRFVSLQSTIFVFSGCISSPRGPKPHGDVGPKVPGLFKGVAVGNNVICVALERTTRMLPNHPHIERVVHEKVSQQRRDWGTLRSPFLPGNEWALVTL